MCEPEMSLQKNYFTEVKFKQGEIDIGAKEEREEEGRWHVPLTEAALRLGQLLGHGGRKVRMWPPELCVETASCFGRLLVQGQMENQEGRQSGPAP